VFTDIEGSTRLLQGLGAEAYADALAEHRRVVREAFDRYDGVEVGTEGDSFFVAFATAPAAIAAAADARDALSGGPIRLRMGMHTGTPHISDDNYVGEDVHRAARIAAAGHGGQILVSSSTASLIDDTGLRDLGEHRLKDLSAPERIYQLGDEPFPPLKSLHQTNLPVPATRFLGRQRELGEVAALLATGASRVLTLTGPAGAGKTRLALQAAGEAADAYPDGIFWVPLAALRDPTLVLEVAAQALDARDGLRDRIGDRRLLLILDNFEHLIDAADELAGLLADCPNVRLLVTSRELLRIPGEQAYPVPPLEPQDATELFTARAQAVDPGFQPDAAVHELCTRLDNLPLALELAAARIQVLTPEQLLDRLSKRFDLLKAGRGVDSRQQTLRATIAWSYDLLDDEERLLLDRLSVFRGGCTLEAAEEVCDADVDTLQSLIDKSLVRRQADRFWMLETIREYATERLDERGGQDEWHSRHAEYFLSRAEEAAGGGPSAVWKSGVSLETELDNVRRARAYFIASGDVAREARLATSALHALWTQAGVRELKAWLLAALDRSADLDPGLRADVLGAAALATANLGESEEARGYARGSLEIARERNDKRQIEWATRLLSFDERDLDERRRLLHECEILLRELGDDRGLGWVNFLLGITFLDEGRFDEAGQVLETATGTFRELGDEWEASNAENAIAYVLIAKGQEQAARPIIEDALRSAVGLQSAALAVEALAALACVRVNTDPGGATQLLAAADAIAEETGQRLDTTYSLRFVDRATAAARERLGDAFEAEWQAGSELNLTDAVALALGEG
jgi:predicted ATPase